MYLLYFKTLFHTRFHADTRFPLCANNIFLDDKSKPLEILFIGYSFQKGLITNYIILHITSNKNVIRNIGSSKDVEDKKTD